MFVKIQPYLAASWVTPQLKVSIDESNHLLKNIELFEYTLSRSEQLARHSTRYYNLNLKKNERICFVLTSIQKNTYNDLSIVSPNPYVIFPFTAEACLLSADRK